MPSSKGVSTGGQARERLPKKRTCALTRSEYDSIPKHDVIRAWATRDPAGRVCGQAFEVPDEAAAAVGRLQTVSYVE